MTRLEERREAPMYRSRPLAQRVIEASKIRQRFPDRIPVIVEKSENIRTDLPNINKNKYLVPKDLSLGQFIYVIRRQLQLPPDKALFLFVNNKLLPSSELMGYIYASEADTDGFLYVIYSGESVFG